MFIKKYGGLLLALTCCLSLVGCTQEAAPSPVPPDNIQRPSPSEEEVPKIPNPDQPEDNEAPPDVILPPKVETPKPEEPKVEASKPETPKVETPKPETPKPEHPKVEPPKPEPPKVEPPKVEPPVVTPPVATPPVIEPPVVTPPVTTPPVIEPPVVTPPVATPPVVAPPKEEGNLSITIQIGNKSFAAKLEDNATARAFSKLLPLTLAMKDLNANEKFYYLEEGLTPNGSAPGRVENGDLMLYGSDCLVLFYESFSTPFHYTRLGAVEDTSGFKAALGSGSVTITFSLA